MGIERDEVPSRVKGGALVGLGEAQKPHRRFFSRRLKERTQHPKGSKMGFERDEVPSRVKGSALVGLGEAQNAASNFRQRRKSTDKQHETIKPQAEASGVTSLWLLLAKKQGC